MSFAVIKWDTNVYSDGDANTTVYAEFECDTIGDLPARDYMTGYVLQCGSKAHVIADNTDYKMQTSGAWILQRSADVSQLVTDISILQQEAEAASNMLINHANRIDKLEAVAVDLINGGAKNIMPLSNPLASETKRGITATYDFAAGTITLNGTHDGTGDATFYLYTGNAADQKIIPAGSYHLSGCPAGGSTETYCLIVQSVGGSPAYKLDTGSGQDFTISSDGRMAPIIRIRKPTGQTVSFDNAVFRPMICTQAAWDISDKFVPYSPTNAELYALIKGYHP